MFLVGIESAVQPSVLLLTAVGVALGLFMSAIPGLTTTVAVVLLLPFTFYLPIGPSMGMLVGVFAGGMAGGAISAILIDIPGNPASVITNLDGYPMTRMGLANRALSVAFLASVMGGLFGLVVLVLVAPQLASVALLFGAPEQFALVLLGLTLIAGFSEGSLSRGLISAGAGLAIATIGMDPITGMPRYTFDTVMLQQGVSFIAVMIGMFALPVAIESLRRTRSPGLTIEVPRWSPLHGLGEALRALPVMIRTILQSSAVGTMIGAIPGTGSAIAAILAYQYAKRFPRDASIQFGDGNPEGVAAPEAANSAMMGGALIPMLTLGIPGDPVTAVMLGALMIQGLNPGPLLIQQNPEVVYGLFGAFGVALILLMIIATVGIPLFVLALRLPIRVMMPTIVLLCIVGSYALRNSLFDVWVMLGAGVLAFYMKKWNYPVLPMLLAIILGPILETQFRMSLIISFGDPLIFFQKPISLALLILAAIYLVCTLVWTLTGEVRRRAIGVIDGAPRATGVGP